MDLRGVPLAVVEAATRALQESDGLREWVAVYPGSDSDLLSELAPVVQAGIGAFLHHQALAAECEAVGAHPYEVVLDEDGAPAGVACSHCGSSYAVQPAPNVPGPGGPPSKPRATKTAKARKRAAGAPQRRLEALRPDPVPEAPERPEETAAPNEEPPPVELVHCRDCDEVIDPGDAQLRKANQAVATLGPWCARCLLTCQVGEPHTVEDYNQAVLTVLRRLGRMCKPHMREQTAAASA